MKKRGLLLAGAIVGTVITALMTIGSLILVLGVSAAGSVGSTGDPENDAALALGVGFLLVVTVITLLLSVTALVLNIMSIVAFGKSAEGFKKYKATVITAIVFNFLIALFAIIGMFTGNVSAMSVIETIAIIVAAVLMLVDVCLEKKRVAEAQTQAQAQVQTQPQVQTVEQPKPENTETTDKQ